MEIDYKALTDNFRGKFTRLRNEKFPSLSFSLDDEQSFLKSEALDQSDNLFIVVQYGEASTSLGNYTLQVTFTALGLKDEVATARDFLSLFATKYNLVREDNMTLVLNTATISSDFNQAGNGYRSLCTLGAIAVVGEKGVSFDTLTYIDDDGKQTPIALLGFNDSTTNNLAPQVYGDTNGRTRSYAVSQTYTFTFNTYSLNNALTTKINKAKYGNESKEDITYRFTLRLSDGSGFTDWKFHLVNATYSHTIGNIDAVSYTFTL